MTREQEIESRLTYRRQEAFDHFMNQPTIRLLVSMIPTSDNPDTLKTLLQESFNTGWNGGSGSLAAEFLRGIITSPRRN